MALVLENGIWSLQADSSGGATPSLTSYTPDGTSITLGTLTNGYRTVSGGGLPPSIIYDPSDKFRIVSNATDGRFEFTLNGAVTSGHYSPGEEDNHFVAGPYLIIDGTIKDNAYLELKGVDMGTGATASTSRVAMGIIDLSYDHGTSATAYRTAGRWSGVNVFGGVSPAARILERTGVYQHVVVSSTSVTYPVDLKYTFSEDDGSADANPTGAVSIAGGADQSVLRPSRNGRWAIAISGADPGTYHITRIDVNN